MYDIWSPFDPNPYDEPDQRARLEKRLVELQQTIHVVLLDLRPVVENVRRDENQVGSAFRLLAGYTNDIPPHPNDLPEIERLCRLTREIGGTCQGMIQEKLMRLDGNAAHPSSLPFFLDALHFTKRGDSFGPERRQLALWGLARLARWHNLPEAYATLLAGLDDHHPEVRWTAADLLLDAYLDARRAVPAEVRLKLAQMAKNDPDPDLRNQFSRYLDEPWGNKE